MISSLSTSSSIELSSLFGMSLYSFENYLYEAEGVTITTSYVGRKSVVTVRRGLHTVSSFENDAAGSLSALLLSDLRTKFPEGDAFKSFIAAPHTGSYDCSQLAGAFDLGRYKNLACPYYDRATKSNKLQLKAHDDLITRALELEQHEGPPPNYVRARFYNAVIRLFMLWRREIPPVFVVKENYDTCQSKVSYREAMTSWPEGAVVVEDPNSPIPVKLEDWQIRGLRAYYPDCEVDSSETWVTRQSVVDPFSLIGSTRFSIEYDWSVNDAAPVEHLAVVRVSKEPSLLLADGYDDHRDILRQLVVRGTDYNKTPGMMDTIKTGFGKAGGFPASISAGEMSKFFSRFPPEKLELAAFISHMAGLYLTPSKVALFKKKEVDWWILGKLCLSKAQIVVEEDDGKLFIKKK